MIRRPPRSTQSRSSAASDVYKRQDYVYADNDARRVYVPRGGNTLVFDLDSHKYIGAITNIGGHGVAIDTATHHGFCSGGKVGMFDTGTMQKIKDIDVQGRPDGILLEPLTDLSLIHI